MNDYKDHSNDLADRYNPFSYTIRRSTYDDHHSRIIGDLSIRGVTREVVLDAEYVGTVTSPWRNVSAGFNARTKINRHDWGLTWNQALEAGAVFVGDEFSIELELLKQDAQPVETEQAATVSA